MSSSYSDAYTRYEYTNIALSLEDSILLGRGKIEKPYPFNCPFEKHSQKCKEIWFCIT